MKLNKLVIGALLIAIAGALAVGSYFFTTKDPTPIKVDPKTYDDFVGYYVFPTGYPLTIRREGDRLMSSVPEHVPTQLFPETETRFFIKGNPARLIFHRDDQGHVDYAISRGKNF